MQVNRWRELDCLWIQFYLLPYCHFILVYCKLAQCRSALVTISSALWGRRGPLGLLGFPPGPVLQIDVLAVSCVDYYGLRAGVKANCACSSAVPRLAFLRQRIRIVCCAVALSSLKPVSYLGLWSLSSAPSRRSFVLPAHAAVQVDQAVYTFPRFAHQILLEDAARRCIEHISAQEVIIAGATTRRNGFFIPAPSSPLP